MQKAGQIISLHADQQSCWKGSKSVASSFKLFEKHEPSSPYSVKLVTKGAEKYCIEGSTYFLKAGDFLIVNQGESVETSIHTKQFTEGICIYPSTDLLDEVYVCLGQTLEQNLNLEGEIKSLDFTTQLSHFNAKSRTSTFLKNHLNRLHFANQLSQRWWESFYIGLAENLIYDQIHLNQKLIRINSTKRQTKEELYRRVKKARDFIHDNQSEQIDLEQLCQLSSLSKYHFLRSFKAIYNQTPYQYLLKLKLAEAKILLAKHHSFEETSQLIGFSGGQNLRKAIKKVS